MKRSLLAFATIALTITLYGCSTGSSSSSDDTTTAPATTTPPATTPGSTTLNNVPSKIAMALPKSLDGKTQSSGGGQDGKNVRQARSAVGTSSAICASIRQDTTTMKFDVAAMGIWAVYINSIIDQNPGIAGKGETAVSLTVTQTMVDQVQSLVGDLGLNQDMKKEIGNKIELKATYKTDNTGDYANSMSVSSGEGMSVTFQWDTSKTKSMMTQTTKSTTTNTEIINIFDSTANKMTTSVYDNGEVFITSFQKTDKGFIVFETASLKTPDAQLFYTGYADDNGGYMRQVQGGTATGYGSIDNTEESFDSNGLTTELASSPYPALYKSSLATGGTNAVFKGTSVYTASTNFADGYYIVSSDNTITSYSDWKYDSSVGIATVAGKTLAILKSGGQSTLLGTKGSTVYLYPFSIDSNNGMKILDGANKTSITIN